MSFREDVAVGWEALDQWGDDVARLEPLTGGVGVNEVWSVRVSGQLAVGRLGTRSDADLAWETDLLRHLDRAGLTVPVPIPTTEGRHFADGMVVMTYVEGEPPETEADWRRVADTLCRLHQLTQNWPQRPDWLSSTDLLHAETGTKIDLGAMPAEGVARCRAAWARLSGRERCVVHGDPNARVATSPHEPRPSGRADRLGTAARPRRRPRPRSRVATQRRRSRRRHARRCRASTGRMGRRRLAGTPAGPTRSQSSGLPRFERSEQQRQRTPAPRPSRTSQSVFDQWKYCLSRTRPSPISVKNNAVTALERSDRPVPRVARRA